MKDGNLASGSCPRISIVWEGAVAICNDEKKFWKLAGKGRYAEALENWYPVELVARKIGWLYHRKSVNIEVISYISVKDKAEFQMELTYWLDRHGLPILGVTVTTPEIMSRQASFIPDLVKIYDPEPERWAMYGGKGEFLHRVEQIGAFNG